MYVIALSNSIVRMTVKMLLTSNYEDISFSAINIIAWRTFEIVPDPLDAYIIIKVFQGCRKRREF
jgi:hypothetical protein